jgi:hypothetical protein
MTSPPPLRDALQRAIYIQRDHMERETDQHKKLAYRHCFNQLCVLQHELQALRANSSDVSVPRAFLTEILEAFVESDVVIREDGVFRAGGAREECKLCGTLPAHRATCPIGKLKAMLSVPPQAKGEGDDVVTDEMVRRLFDVLTECRKDVWVWRGGPQRHEYHFRFSDEQDSKLSSAYKALHAALQSGKPSPDTEKGR